jgi:DNA-binding CsgD family transcriptional regulator
MKAWPFLGRDDELAAIDEGFTGTEVDSVVVAGPAGVGKTALARAALARLSGGDRRVEWVAGTRARLLRRSGQRGRAALAQARAATLRARCAEASTPLLRTDDVTELLTPREREILLLAARHSSRQIADRPGLAVATVNNNLARAYTKLGISGRADIRALLGPAPGPADPHRR